MANEILSIPDEHLADAILVIRLGLEAADSLIVPEIKQPLSHWCDETEAYLERLKAP
jgi:hypothetical protein